MVVDEYGIYRTIIDNSTGKDIGELTYSGLFGDSNNGADDDDVRLGTLQGYGFFFPNDSYMTDSLGYTDSIISSDLFQGNRKFVFEDGETLFLFNLLVLHATGKYKKYEGSYIKQIVIENSTTYPDAWVAEILLRDADNNDYADDKNNIDKNNDHGNNNNDINSGEGDGEDDYDDGGDNDDGYYDFRITSDGGFWEAITDPDTGDAIGERFQNPVLDSNGTRIGTNQGYAFDFLDYSFIAEKYTPKIGLGNRVFYLDDGVINVLDEIIVGATGVYTEYKGGTFEETVISSNPTTNYISEITLIRAALYYDNDGNNCTIHSNHDDGSHSNYDDSHNDDNVFSNGEEEDLESSISGGGNFRTTASSCWLVFGIIAQQAAIAWLLSHF